MRRRLALIGILAAFAAYPAAAIADTAPTPGNTSTVVCTFDPSVDPGVTTCSWKTVQISNGYCFTSGQRVYFVVVFRSTRTYRGNAVLRELNGVTITGDFGSAPLTDDGFHAWDDSIYAHVARPNAQIVSQNSFESRLEDTEIIVDDASCV